MKFKRREFLQSGVRWAHGLGVVTLALQAGAQETGISAKPRDPRRDAELQKLLEELESSQAQFYNVPRKDGEFLSLLTKIARARQILEIGTANGYSAIWLSLALQETGGQLTTIEIQPQLVRAAKENLKRARLDHLVHFREGDAHQVVTQLDGPFDLVFIDAELGGKMDYFQKIFPKKLRAGGLIVCHNAITYRSAMQDYLDFIKAHPDFDTVILSLTMQDGFCVSYRRQG
ncbi:MAG: O-methyltransferase [Verrucomicrobiota bacterium]